MHGATLMGDAESYPTGLGYGTAQPIGCQVPTLLGVVEELSTATYDTFLFRGFMKKSSGRDRSGGGAWPFGRGRNNGTRGEKTIRPAVIDTCGILGILGTENDRMAQFRTFLWFSVHLPLSTVMRRVSMPCPSLPTPLSSCATPLHEVALGLIDQHAPISVHGPRLPNLKAEGYTSAGRSRATKTMSGGAAPSGKLLFQRPSGTSLRHLPL